MSRMVWIVGKVLDADQNCWEFQGVFTSEKLAVNACRDEKFFRGADGARSGAAL